MVLKKGENLGPHGELGLGFPLGLYKEQSFFGSAAVHFRMPLVALAIPSRSDQLSIKHKWSSHYKHSHPVEYVTLGSKSVP